MEKLLISCLLLSGLSACSGDHSRGELAADQQLAADVAFTEVPQAAAGRAALPAEEFSNTAEAGRPEAVEAPSRKLVKDGSMEIQVENYREGRDSVLAMLERFGGYAAGESESRQSYRISNTFELRVPAARFDELMEAIAGYARQVAYRSVNVRDVTGEYYDLELRIRNKKELEKRYLDLLSRAGTVKEILEIEETLNNVRTEIESMEGSLKQLTGRIDYSTIHLTLFEVLRYRYEPAPVPRFTDRVLASLQAGWNGFLSVVVALFVLWPYFLVAALAVGLVLVLKRRRQGP